MLNSIFAANIWKVSEVSKVSKVPEVSTLGGFIVLDGLRA
jgi:hypothetical protein